MPEPSALRDRTGGYLPAGFAIFHLLTLLLLSGCRPEAPSAVHLTDPWVGVEEDMGRTFVDPSGLPDIDFDPRQHVVPRVVDGDTIKVLIEGRSETVRLLGINTPESVDPRRPVQCFGREASARMEALVEGRRVHLATDPAEDRYDRNGRLLAYVWLTDGTLVNLEMIRGGYANEADYGAPYAYRELFRAEADRARAEGLGLWDARTCDGDYGAPAEDFSDRIDPYAPSGPIPPSDRGGELDPFDPDRSDDPLGQTEQVGDIDIAPPGLRIGRVVFDGSRGPAEPDEYVEIINDGPPVEVGGYQLLDEQDNRFVFPDFRMVTGRRCRVYTDLADVEHCGLSFYSPEAIWANGGDRARLLDPEGRLIDQRCWGSSCGQR